MRVLHIINSLATGGAEKLILETLPKYTELGITVDVLLLNGTSHLFLEELKKAHAGEIFVLGTSCPYQLKFVLKLMPYFKRYDVVHAHLFPATYFSALAKKISFSKTPLIFTEHNTSNKRFRNKMYRFINSKVYSLFDHIICINEEVKKEVLQKTAVPENKLTVINNGVDVMKISAASPIARKVIHPALSQEDFLLLQVSSFREQKDQPTVIRALALLPEKVKLLFAGAGAMRKNCEELVKAIHLEDRVFFLGNRMDIPQLFKSIDVGVLSSNYEGFGLVAVEAMAAGKPFLASDVPGLSEVVGSAGILFPKGDERRLAEEIIYLMNDKTHYEKIAAACTKRASNFGIDQMVREHIQLYQRLQR